ncbi:MAG: alpha-L-fucosidase [Tidjanibacter sp.]|nr:alpha-L-fucosidase [Tidjanibacter sp.]
MKTELNLVSALLLSVATATATAQVKPIQTPTETIRLNDEDTPRRVVVQLPGGKAKDAPKGSFEATWESVKENYVVPEWFMDAKFGIFMHWGVYSVPAAGSEWYPKHMYNGMLKYHTETWGNPKDFGYKDFIPMFKAEHFDPEAWADLFVEAGAKYVIPTAEHHDGFALYDSDLTEWDAVEKGPHRDLIGDLSKAVRAKGLKFGISNHRIENWDFMYPGGTNEHDLFDPVYAGLYGPPQKPSAVGSAMGAGTDSNGNPAHPQSDEFLEEWLARAQEIVDKYHPDLYYFDNGVNSRSLDPWKLRFAQYYYNSAEQWGKQVSIQTKSDAYLYGTIKDYERQGKAPTEYEERYWQVDDPIGHKFGYVQGLQLQTSGNVIRSLVENISKNGNLCLNISPKADGTIPEDQQAVLREVGRWLRENGEGVYGTRAWKVFGEGESVEHNKAPNEWRFTKKGDNELFAFALDWGGGDVEIKSFTLEKAGRVKRVELLGEKGRLKFEQRESGLLIKAPERKDNKNDIRVFKIQIAR